MKCIPLGLVIILFSLMSSPVYAEEIITLASNGEAAPGWSEYSLEHGYVVHIVREAFQAAGIKVQMEWYPWKRAFKLAKKYEVESTCCWYPLEERKKDFYYSDPVIDETQVFFHLKSFAFDWNSVEDLYGIPIGADIGLDYDALEAANKDGKILLERVPSYEQNLKKLIAGRIKLYPAALITAYDNLRDLFPPETVDLLTYHSKPLLQKQLHLLIPKKMDKKRAMRLLSLFNQGLQQLKTSGSYGEIMQAAAAGAYRKQAEKWTP